MEVLYIKLLKITASFQISIDNTVKEINKF